MAGRKVWTLKTAFQQYRIGLSLQQFFVGIGDIQLNVNLSPAQKIYQWLGAAGVIDERIDAQQPRFFRITNDDCAPPSAGAMNFSP